MIVVDGRSLLAGVHRSYEGIRGKRALWGVGQVVFFPNHFLYRKLIFLIRNSSRANFVKAVHQIDNFNVEITTFSTFRLQLKFISCLTLHESKRWLYVITLTTTFVYWLIDCLIDWLIDWLIDSFRSVRSFVRSFIHSLVRLFIYLFIYSFFVFCLPLVPGRPWPALVAYFGTSSVRP